MENSYGIGVTNRYALFLDDAEDPLEVLKVQEQEKEAKKKTKLSEKENKGKAEPKGKPVQVPRKGIKETQNVKAVDSAKPKEESRKPQRPPPERSERNVKFAGETREERNNRRNREDRPPNAVDFTREGRETRERDGLRNDGSDIRPRGRGMGRGLGRGRGIRGAPGGRGGYDNRGKREFDRQSGSDKTHGNYSGVKPVDKREGGGAHNWGNHKDDMEEQLNTTPEEQQDWGNDKPETEPTPAPEQSENTRVTNSEGDGAAVTADGEEGAQTEGEPLELTLDEYKALRGARQPPTYNLRKAGEGEDMTQWKKMYALKKKEGEEEDDDEDEEYDASEYPQRVGRLKHLLAIDIHFADSRRGMRGRGRGGPRGTTRGGPRGGAGGPPRNTVPGGGAERPEGRPLGMGRGERFDRERFDREPRGERVERDYQNRGQRQSAPKVDDEHDFPSLG